MHLGQCLPDAHPALAIPVDDFRSEPNALKLGHAPSNVSRDGFEGLVAPGTVDPLPAMRSQRAAR